MKLWSRVRGWGFRRVAVVALAAWWLAAWAAAHALVAGAELERADALVVLGGSASYVERTRRAAELFKEGRAPRVILTDDGERGGWSSSEQRNPFFVERAAEELRGAGVPDECIEVLPRQLSSTHEEAEALRAHASQRGYTSLLVVTSAYHSRRARWTWRRVFEGSGITFGLEAVAPGTESPRFATWWFYPSGWRQVAGEYVKLAYYFWHY